MDSSIISNTTENVEIVEWKHLRQEDNISHALVYGKEFN